MVKFGCRARRAALFAGGCMTALLGGAALAQPAVATPVSNDSSQSLEEVVVTATRQTNTVNRVPLSVTARAGTVLCRSPMLWMPC